MSLGGPEAAGTTERRIGHLLVVSDRRHIETRLVVVKADLIRFQNGLGVILEPNTIEAVARLRVPLDHYTLPHLKVAIGGEETATRRVILVITLVGRLLKVNRAHQVVFLTTTSVFRLSKSDLLRANYQRVTNIVVVLLFADGATTLRSSV